MTPTESIEQVAYMKAMFPGTNREQEDFWYEQFQKYPREAVHSAIYEFSEKHGDFVDRPGLLSLIQSRVSDSVGAESRVRAEVLAFEQRRKLEAEQRQKADKSFAAVNLALDNLSDPELDQLKTTAMSAAPEDLHSFLGRSDPKRSAVLRYMMAQYVGRKPETAVVR